MARAVVTGAAGFLGGAVAHALRRQGYEVLALDVRRGPGVLPADITVPGDWEKALSGADLVVHAAAVGLGGVGELTPVRAGRASAPVRVTAEELRRVALGGTAAVLDAAERAGVSRVVTMSCVSVFGGDFPDGVDETAPVGLTGDPQADLLAAAEQTVSAACAHGMNATVLRIGDAYGPRAGRWTLWPVLLLRAGRFVLVDGGRGVLSPVHVDDVVDAVLAVVSAPAADVAGAILQVTGPGPVTAAEFFGHYARMADLRPPRAVPARLCEAMDAIDRLRPSVAARLSAADRRAAPGRVAGSGDPTGSGGPTGSGRSSGGPRGGFVRGIGARIAANVDPRTHVDLGPLTFRDLTRTGTYSSAKIADVTGWRPRVDLAEGMRRTEAWLRDCGLLGIPEPSRRG